MRVSSCVLLCLFSASLVSGIAILDVPKRAPVPYDGNGMPVPLIISKDKPIGLVDVKQTGVASYSHADFNTDEDEDEYSDGDEEEVHDPHLHHNEEQDDSHETGTDEDEDESDESDHHEDSGDSETEDEDADADADEVADVDEVEDDAAELDESNLVEDDADDENLLEGQGRRLLKFKKFIPKPIRRIFSSPKSAPAPAPRPAPAPAPKAVPAPAPRPAPAPAPKPAPAPAPAPKVVVKTVSVPKAVTVATPVVKPVIVVKETTTSVKKEEPKKTEEPKKKEVPKKKKGGFLKKGFSVIKKVASKVADKVDDVPKAAVKVVKAAAPVAVKVVKAAAPVAVKVAKAVAPVVVPAVSLIPGSTVPLTIIKTAVPKIKDAVTKIKSATKKIKAVKKIDNAISKVKKVTPSIVSKVKDASPKIVSKIKDAKPKILDKIKGLTAPGVKKASSNLVSKVKKIVPTVKKNSTKLVSKVKKLVPKINGVKIYGNYCGPNYCGGQKFKGAEGPNCRWGVAPKDSLDSCCKLHDQCCGTPSSRGKSCNKEILSCVKNAKCTGASCSLAQAAIKLTFTTLKNKVCGDVVGSKKDKSSKPGVTSSSSSMSSSALPKMIVDRTKVNVDKDVPVRHSKASLKKPNTVTVSKSSKSTTVSVSSPSVEVTATVEPSASAENVPADVPVSAPKVVADSNTAPSVSYEPFTTPAASASASEAATTDNSTPVVSKAETVVGNTVAASGATDSTKSIHKEDVVKEINNAIPKTNGHLDKLQTKLKSILTEMNSEQVRIETENRNNFDGASVTLKNEQLRLEASRKEMKALYDETERLNATIQTHYKKLIADTDYLQTLDAMRPEFLKSLGELASHIQAVKTVVDQKIVKDEYKDEMITLLTGIHLNTNNISGYVATAFINHYNKYKNLLKTEDTDYAEEVKKLSKLAAEYKLQAQKTEEIEKERARIEEVLTKFKNSLTLSVSQREEFDLLVKDITAIFNRRASDRC